MSREAMAQVLGKWFGQVQTFNNLRDQYATEDNAYLGKLNYIYDPLYQGSPAFIWGKSIPMTWGKRRIVGNLVQVGLTKAATSQDLVHTYTPEQIWFSGQSALVWDVRITDAVRTASTTMAYIFGRRGNTESRVFLAKLWVDQALVYDFEAGQGSGAVKFHFYDGNENQLPDAELNRDRYELPVAYRDRMVIVLYDYKRERFGGPPTPLLEAEFWEESSNDQTPTEIDIPGAGFFNDGLVYDAKRNFAYALSNGLPQFITKYDLATNEVIQRVQIRGAEATEVVGFGLLSAIGSVTVASQTFLLGSNNASNSTTLYSINADTGVVADSIGESSGSLTPSPNNINGIKRITSTKLTVGAVITVCDQFETYHEIFVTTEGQFQHRRLHTFPPGTSLNMSYVMGTPTGRLINLTVTNETVYKDNVPWFNKQLAEVAGIIPSYADNCIIVFERSIDASGDWRITKINVLNDFVPFTANQDTHPDIDGVPSSFDFPALLKSNTLNQKFAWETNAKIAILDFIAGTLIAVPNMSGRSGFLYDAYANRMIYANGANLGSFPVYSNASGRMPLSQWLRDVAKLRGYEDADIQVNGIDDTIDGAAITVPSDLDDALRNVALLYNFTIKKLGKRITFERRVYGQGFLSDDYVNEQGRVILSEEDGLFITATSERAANEETPGAISLTYIDSDFNYSPVTAMHKRNDNQLDINNELKIAVPIIMKASEAQTLAARLIIEASVSRLQHTFLLPTKNYDLEQGDVIDLDFGDYTDTVKLVQVDYNGDHSLSCVGEVLLTGAGVPYEMPAYEYPTKPNILTDGPGEAIIFNTPLLDPADAAPGGLERYATIGPAGRQAVSSGAVVSVGADGGKSELATVPSPAVIGSVSNADRLNEDAQAWIWEETRILTMRMVQGVPSYSNKTLSEVLAGANRVLVGNMGRWEFIGFTGFSYDDVTKICTLSGLVRGMRGTDVNIANHAGGDRAIFYDNSVVLGVESFDKFEKAGTYIVRNARGTFNYEDVTAVMVDGSGRKPWAPSAVKLAQSGGDIVMTWERRTRLTGPLHDNDADVPLDEATEEYELDIYRNGAIVRAVTGLSARTFTYTAAMQSADGFTSPSSIKLDLYQISATVGRGFARAGTYNVE